MLKNLYYLKLNAIFQSVYVFISFPIYLYVMVKLPDFHVLATLYLVLLVIHEVVFMIALVFLWLGYLKKSRHLIIVSSGLMVIGGAFVYISYIVIIPFLAVNILYIKKSKKT